MPNLTASDLINRIQTTVSCEGLKLEQVEIKFRMNGNDGTINLTLKKKRKIKSGLTHDMVVWNKTEKKEDISCPECGGVVIIGCSGYCSRCYNRLTAKGSIGFGW